MKILYKNNKICKQCTDLKTAKKLFGGNEALTISLMSRINAMQQASVLKDIIMTPSFHFHKLKGNLEGLFSIDVKTHHDSWRIIIRPLDEKERPFSPCNIDIVAEIVEVIVVEEVSKHYE